MVEDKIMELPDKVKLYMNLIIDDGYECYLVGGAVRDYIIGIDNKDYDITTNMPFDKLQEIIPNIIIMKENEHRNTATLRDKNDTYEFTLFRGNTLDIDLSNRDFKMNSIAVDINGNFIDPLNGINDIKEKKISLVSNESIDIDPLRILRAIRQSSKLDFNIDSNTKSLLLEKKDLLSTVAPERIYSELKMILLSNNVEKYLLEYKEIFFEIIPELKICDGFNQYNDYHIYDIYTHLVKVVSNIEPNIYLRLASLFHDIGKPLSFNKDENGIGHFLGHPKISKDIFMKFAKKYKIDNKTKKIVSSLIYNHENILSNKNNKIYNFYSKFNMDYIELLFDLKKADALGQNPKYIYRLDLLDKQMNKYISIRNKIKNIKYNGEYLVELGYKGKIIGEILDDVKRRIVNNELINEPIYIDRYVLTRYPLYDIEEYYNNL